jgi:outer membrane receptor protein involved in Fe transport
VARANGVLGVNDTFQAEIADTYEVGVKGQMFERRLTVDADVFHTQSRNGYFFVYIAADSTQNLGNLSATYKGAELALTGRPPIASTSMPATATPTAASLPWRTPRSSAIRLRSSRRTP